MTEHREDHADRHGFGGPDQLNLTGFPGLVPNQAWSTYVPTLSGGWVVGPGNLVARWARAGRIIVVHIRIVWATGSTFGASPLGLSTPVPAAAGSVYTSGHCSFSDNGVGFSWGFCQVVGNTITPYAYLVSGTRLTGSQITATSPQTWSNGDDIQLDVVYEAAS